MKWLKVLLVLFVLLACTSCNKKINKNRQEILGRDFSNNEVKSIDIVEIEHPMLGGVVETITLSESQKKKFLEDFDQLNIKGVLICKSKYVVRLNFQNDTLRLKICETFVANRNNDMYYELGNGKNIISEYLKYE